MIEPISDEDLWDIPSWALESRRQWAKHWMFSERRFWSTRALTEALKGVLDREAVIAVLSDGAGADVRSIQTVYLALSSAPRREKAGE